MNYCPKCGAEEVKEQGSESWRFKCHSFFNTDGRRETLTTYKDGYQYVKSGGYWKTKTTIESVYE